MKRRLFPWLGASALIALGTACGGGGGGSPASTTAQIVYGEPADASQWRLVRASTSSGTLLVLDLLAPEGSAGRGVTLVLSTDPDQVAWQPVDGTSLVKNLAYGGTLVSKASPQGGDLRVLVSQTPGTAVPYGSTPVLSVALALKPAAAPGTLPLTVSQAAHLGSTATPGPIVVAVGTLRVQ